MSYFPPHSLRFNVGGKKMTIGFEKIAALQHRAGKLYDAYLHLIWIEKVSSNSMFFTPRRGPEFPSPFIYDSNTKTFYVDEDPQVFRVLLCWIRYGGEPTSDRIPEQWIRKCAENLNIQFLPHSENIHPPPPSHQGTGRATHPQVRAPYKQTLNYGFILKKISSDLDRVVQSIVTTISLNMNTDTVTVNLTQDTSNPKIAISVYRPMSSQRIYDFATGGFKEMIDCITGSFQDVPDETIKIVLILVHENSDKTYPLFPRMEELAQKLNGKVFVHVLSYWQEVLSSSSVQDLANVAREIQKSVHQDAPSASPVRTSNF
eukprot:TRINITY_DN1093_c0_g1_i1.p1 TRINITY_DN1093_c0_g1~~TRINITY_DN1093_c0_g1_i1.p1  ORF type:complete len:317 (+),score=32.86 TRINITY_DN1093_c0_g1_i1:1157-2107(+)